MPYPNVSHLPGEDISHSTDFKPATISQPLINSIPPDLLPRFDPVFAKYHTHYSAGRLSIYQIPLKELRTNPRKYSIVYGRAIAPDVHSITDVQCPVSPSGDGKSSITVRIYEPAPNINGGKPRPAYINFHGGGWIIGGLESDMEFCKRLVGELGCVVFDVDYRLAPEYQYPIPVNDCIEAFKWIGSDDMVQKRNLDRQKFAVGGMSAGGMLAAVVSHVCRDEGLPLSFQILGVPVIDVDGYGPDGKLTDEGWKRYESYRELEFTVPLPAVEMEYFVAHFLGEKRDPETYNNWKVSPILSSNFKGLAPALIMTAEMDLLRDEGEAYGEKMNAAGSQAEVIRMKGMPHTFMAMDDILEDGKRYNREAIRALATAWGINK
ncbi:hypothetical protein SS1G_01731 [Sclerotinia sclerotiorum 1980 UF-70]|uniref:Alpha/beta hydrolase fold-3 domain-containing protein n=2 Tax=Sclerotinia sclerotiorum (strain ATCC 18683 / 1980 / Ss-1) TaxID=665079 RepID=A7E8V3_SCLS1|nr:hypothetical protein SS1G_01731 [Sclerotinia sclerotiorum 1980 UF-70]APA05881.1 hypothetical protein sscle_01g006510 [Sclerotinia sclerotiorum 1980 UF-70]EDN96805.1 hypothetical protein SS1G_01731 [Sclerotinia sclerotiorum 1980 UF-70]